MMKIAIFSDAFYPQVNGVVTHILNIVPLVAKKAEVHLFLPNFNKPYPEKIENCFIHYVPSLPLPVYPDFRLTSIYYPGLMDKIKKINPDIIHVEAPATLGWCGVIIAQKLHVPIVGTFHTYFTDPGFLRIMKLDIVGLDKAKWFINALWKYSNWFYNKAVVTIAPTKLVANDLIKHKIKSKVEVISVGIDTKPYQQFNNLTIQQFKEKYILSLGRIAQGKSLDILVKAFAKASKDVPDVRLKIAGDGPMLAELKNLVKELDIEEKVDFIGFLQRDEKVALFKNATCFISTSISETFGLTFLEAMSCGTPVIGARAGGSYEIIKDYGITCEAEDIDAFTEAIIQVCTDEKLHSELSKKALEGVKPHTVEKTAEKLLELYASVSTTSSAPRTSPQLP